MAGLIASLSFFLSASECPQWFSLPGRAEEDRVALNGSWDVDPTPTSTDQA